MPLGGTIDRSDVCGGESPFEGAMAMSVPTVCNRLVSQMVGMTAAARLYAKTPWWQEGA